jgi:acetyl esterase/lipase
MRSYVRASHRGVCPIAFLIWLVPNGLDAQVYSSAITPEYEHEINITYVKMGAWEGKLDVFHRRDQGPHPTLIWFHGGPSTGGFKEVQTLFLLPYLEWGWNVVNVEHRLPGPTLAPTAIQNGLCALRWVVASAKEYGFDTQRIVTSGLSSGGWFALTTGLAPRAGGWEPPCPGTGNERVAAVVNWYGVTDLADVLEGPNAKPYARGWLLNVPNALSVARDVSPLAMINRDAPPVITIHGANDAVVPTSHAVRLHKALEAAGGTHELIVVPGAGHGPGSFPRDQSAALFERIKAFLKRASVLPQ